MPSSAPLVTVGMAVYGGERYIADAIRSVQAEKYANWELLLVDDRSPDGSVEIIRTFSDPRIRLVHNEVNLGLVGVRNRILREARGEYLSWLDQDDLTYPDRLSSQIEFLQTNREYSLCGSWTDMRHEAEDGSFENLPERLPVDHADIRSAMPFLNPIACNTVTMRTADFIARGLEFNPAFGDSLDYDLWSRASDQLRLHNLPRALGAYRVHASQTSQGAALDRMNAHALRIQQELIERALGISMNDEDRRIHSRATVAPIAVGADEDLASIAQWFGRLRTANEQARAFDSQHFDKALARQWTTVALSAIGSATNRTSTVKAIASGFSTIGVRKSAIGTSTWQGLRRRLARKS